MADLLGMIGRLFGPLKAWIVTSMAYLKAGGDVRPNVRLLVAEVLTAADRAGYKVRVTFGFNAGSTPEHSAGTAVDFMVYGDRAAGDWIADYLWRNRHRLGLRWQLWRQRSRSTSPGKPPIWLAMADRGNPTQNHYDHVHANFWAIDYEPPTTDPADEAQPQEEELEMKLDDIYGKDPVTGNDLTWRQAIDMGVNANRAQREMYDGWLAKRLAAMEKAIRILTARTAHFQTKDGLLDIRRAVGRLLNRAGM